MHLPTDEQFQKQLQGILKQCNHFEVAEELHGFDLFSFFEEESEPPKE